MKTLRSRNTRNFPES